MLDFERDGDDLEIIEDGAFKLAIEGATDTVESVYFRSAVIGLIIPKRLGMTVSSSHTQGNSLVIDFSCNSKASALEKVKRKQEELREAIAELEALQGA